MMAPLEDLILICFPFRYVFQFDVVKLHFNRHIAPLDMIYLKLSHVCGTCGILRTVTIMHNSPNISIGYNRR